ncbi:MAG: Gfo/Idh/MocA family oxidoreductase [Acidimicrobiales bacterium]
MAICARATWPPMAKTAIPRSLVASYATIPPPDSLARSRRARSRRRQVEIVGAEIRGVDDQPLLAGGHVEAPQRVHRILRPRRPQERDEAAVGGDLHVAGRPEAETAGHRLAAGKGFGRGHGGIVTASPRPCTHGAAAAGRRLVEPLTGPIRWGIAGTGGIAASFRRDLASVDDAVVVAVGSRSAEAAAGFAADHGITGTAGTYADLAADPDVDVVYVAGIHPVHAPQAVQFLEAGKHVLVEKPIALTASEVDRMIAAATAHDRFLMEAMWMRFNPAHVELVHRLRTGAIGEPRRIVADFSFALPYAPEHRLWDIAKGGGALLDLGIYPVTLAWWIFGPPESIEVAGHVHEAGADDEVSLLCRWAGGESALLTCGLRLPGPMTARIEGTEGYAHLPAPFHATSRLDIHRGAEVEHIDAPPAGLHHQVAEVHRCLRHGERQSPEVPWATSRAIIERFDALREVLGVRYSADG